jgi:benzoylformate decarboxylase
MTLPRNGNSQASQLRGLSRLVRNWGERGMPTRAKVRPSGREASTAAQVTVREAVFALFRAFRLTTIFGNPGSTELPMYRDFPSDFRYILGLQE